MSFFAYIGRYFINLVISTGSIAQLLFSSFLWIFRRPLRISRIIEEFYKIGATSTGIVILTSFFTGMVEALETYHGFSKFGATSMIGYTVAISFGREIAPVFTALMVVARSVSAMSAEIGSMKVTEQIDALSVMGINPIGYLASPRIVAGFTMLPLLTILSNVAGNIGSYLISVYSLGVSEGGYFENIRLFIDTSDISYGLVKAAVFGVLITIIGCYYGLATTGGTQGVGRSTTSAVVLASVIVLVSDYFLTALMY